MPLASAFREMRNEIGPPLSDNTGTVVQEVEHEVVVTAASEVFKGSLGNADFSGMRITRLKQGRPVNKQIPVTLRSCGLLESSLPRDVCVGLSVG